MAIGRADHLAGVVDSAGNKVGSEIMHRSVPQESVHLPGAGGAAADYDVVLVDRYCLAGGASECTEICGHAIAPDHGLSRRAQKAAPNPRDVPEVIDGHGDKI